MNKQKLKESGLRLVSWEFVRENNPRPLDGHVIANFSSKVFERNMDGVPCSLAQFFLDDAEIYRAWGLKADEHCSYHSVRLQGGSMSSPIESCPKVSVVEEDSKTGAIRLETPEGDVEYPVTYVV